MKVGMRKLFIFLFIIFFNTNLSVFSDDKIQSVPLINLEELSPTFEEDKDILEKEDDSVNLDETIDSKNDNEIKKSGKIFINIKALDKITAKTSDIKLAIGEMKSFGSLEIKGLKCQLSEDEQITDTVAYLQVKDISSNDNNQVFLFNGWTFVSSPTLQSIDHPIYDLWVTGCENI